MSVFECFRKRQIEINVHFRFVAAATMDMDFLAIDINQCPIGIGNEAPNFFAGTAKCKATTMVSLTYSRNIYLHICNHRNWPGF